MAAARFQRLTARTGIPFSSWMFLKCCSLTSGGSGALWPARRDATASRDIIAVAIDQETTAFDRRIICRLAGCYGVAGAGVAGDGIRSMPSPNSRPSASTDDTIRP
jgi:hypothetical protein